MVRVQRHASLSWLERGLLQLEEEEVLGGREKALVGRGKAFVEVRVGVDGARECGTRDRERFPPRPCVCQGLQARSGRSAERACRGTFCSSCWVERYRLGEGDEAFADDALGSKPPCPIRRPLLRADDDFSSSDTHIVRTSMGQPRKTKTFHDSSVSQEGFSDSKENDGMGA